MKILIIGDIHGKKSTLDKVSNVLDQCSELAQRADLTVFLGDLNDTKSTIRSEVQNMLIRKLQEWPGPISILVGNHDYHNAIECGDHSLYALDGLDIRSSADGPSNLIQVIDESSRTVYGDTNLCYIPYLTEERFLLALKQVPPRQESRDNLHSFVINTNILFLHQDIAGFKHNQTSDPIEGRVSPELFKDYTRVFCGHVHMPQSLGNIEYVGTPFTESYSEVGQDKHVVIYDTETDKIEYIKLDVPEHVSFNYEIQTIEDIKAIKKDIKSKTKPSDIIRVVIKAPHEIAGKVKKSLFGDMIDKLKTDKISAVEKVIRVKSGADNKSVMVQYMDQMEVPDNVKAKLIEYNTKIMEDL